MELCPKEGNPEEQSQNADALRLYLHVLTKTELRQERLWGQATIYFAGYAASNQRAQSTV